MEFVCSTFIKKFPGDPYLYQEVEGSRIEGEQEGELKQNSRSAQHLHLSSADGFQCFPPLLYISDSSQPHLAYLLALVFYLIT